jgi:pyochelin biosynthesis protein PchC
MSLLCFRPQRQASIRLVALPAAGGHAAQFRMLAGALPEVELWGYTPPGRAQRRHECPMTSAAEMVSELSELLSRPSPQALVIYGHSLGAVVGFHLVVALEQQGHVVMALICAARSPLAVAASMHISRRDDQELLAALSVLDPSVAELHHQPDLLQLALPVIRTDLRISECTHAGSLSIQAPIIGIGGIDDPTVAVDDLSRWGDHTSARCVVRSVAGAHLFHQSHTSALADVLRQELLS